MPDRKLSGISMWKSLISGWSIANLVGKRRIMARTSSKRKSAPAASKRSALVLINRLSGTVRTRGPEEVRALVRDQLAPAFSQLDVELVEGDIMPALKKAVKSKSHDVVIAGGGDGTIASAAGELIGTGITMGSLPLGTMNLFVQALGFSATLEEALDELAEADEGMVDVGEANGRVFLHQISFGIQPRMARLREKIGYSSRLTKMLAAARALIVVAVRPKMVRVMMEHGGQTQRVKTPMLAVSNNPLGNEANPSLPVSLDGGTLGIYMLEQFSLSALLRLALDYLAGRIDANPAVNSDTAADVKISRRSRRGEKALQASMDGEVLLLESPVHVRIKPKSLKVLVPRKV